MKHIVAIMFAAVLTAGCSGNRQAETATSTEAAIAVEAKADVDTSSADEALIREFYSRCVFGGDEAFAVEHCTPELIEMLRGSYDYDGDGLALWLFRSDAQDGDGESSVDAVTAAGDGWYEVSLTDMGTPVRKRVLVVDSKIADYQ